MLTNFAFGQGETCATAINMPSFPYTDSGNTSGKGDDYDETDACSSNYMKGDDVVYSFTPATNTVINIAVTNTDSWAGVHLFDGCPDAGGTTCIGQDGSSFGDLDISGVSVSAGTTYYIVISTWASPQTTAYTLTVNSCDGEGSSCATAHSIATLPFTDANTACGACDLYSSSNACASTYMNGEEYVYEFTPAYDMDAFVNMWGTTSSAGLYVTRGCPDVGTCVDYDTDYYGNVDSLTVSLVGGVTYYFIVGFSSSAGCDAFNFSIREKICGIGSSCAKAHVIDALPFNDASSACGACNYYSSADACGSTYMNGDEYVYEYTPSSNVDIMAYMSGTDESAGLFITQGCPDVGNCITYDTDYYGDVDLLEASLTAGVTYYFIASFTSYSVCDDFEIAIVEKIDDPPCGNNPLAGNTCENATPICNLNGFCGNTSSTYTGDNLTGNLESEFCGTIENNSWLSFTASSTVTILTVGMSNCANNFGVQMQVYASNDCNTFTKVSTCVSPGSMQDEVLIATGLTPGTKYYLMIDGYGGDNCDYVIGAASGIELPVEVSVEDTSICAGDTIQLYAVNGSGTYSWNTSPVQNTDSIDVSPTVTTEYIVTSVGSNPDCGSTMDTAIVNIGASPTATISGSYSVCDGASADFDVILTGTAPWTIDITNTTNGTTTTTTESGINTSPHTVSVSTAGDYQITAVEDASCTGTTSGTVTVSVNTTPLAPTAPSVTYCINATINDLTATGTGGTLKWYDDAGLTNQVGTGAIFTPTVDNTVSGTTTYYVTEDASGCESDPTKVDIIVSANPDAPTVDDLITYCLNQPINAITATGNGGTINWYSDAGLTSLLASGTSYTPTIDNAVAGSVRIWLNETNGSCISDTTSVLVMVSNAPPGPPADGTSYCIGDDIEDLTATGTGTFTWYSDAGLTTQVGTGSPFTPTVDNSVVGTTTYYVTETENGCTSLGTQVDIDVISNPTTPVASGATYCKDETINDLTATASGGGTITWYDDAGLTNEVGTGSPFTPTVDNTQAGTTSLYVTEKAGSCESSPKKVDIIVLDAPSTPTGNSPSSICAGETIPTLSATAVDGGTLNWYDDAGLTNLVGTGATYTPGIASVASVTNFYVTETDGTCEGQALTLTITIYGIPAKPTAPSPADYCVNDVINDLTVTGSGGIYVWFDDDALSNPLAMGSPFTPTVDNTVAGVTTFYVTETLNNCQSDSTQVHITIVDTDDGSFNYSSASYCTTGADPIPTITGLTGGTFSVAPAGLVINSSTGELDLSASSLGDYVVTYTTNGPCPTQETANIKIVSSVDATFTYPKATYCNSETNPTPTGTDFGVFSATPAGLTFVNVNSGEIDLLNSAAGTYTVKNLISAQSGCAPDSATFTVTIVVPATPTVSSPSAYCAGDAIADLNVTPGNAGTIKWYDDAGLTNLVYTGNPFATGLDNTVDGTFTYYVTETNSGCESIDQSITVTIKPTPAQPTATSPAPYCTGDVISDLTATDHLGGVLNWYDDNGLTNLVNTGATYPTGINSSIPGSYQYFVTETLNGCTSDSTEVHVVVNQTPSTPLAVQPNDYCTEDAIADLTVTGAGGTYNWYDNSSLNTVIGSGTPFYSAVSNMVADSIVFYVTESNGGCISDPDSVYILIKPTPAPPTTIAVSDYCTGELIADLQANGVGGILRWYSDVSLNTFLATGGTLSTGIDTSVASQTTFYVTELLDACESDPSAITVNVYEVPDTPITLVPEDYCDGDVIAELEAISGGTINWFDASFNMIGSGATHPTGLGNGDIGQHIYYAIASANNCTSDYKKVTIEINETPTAPSVVHASFCDDADLEDLYAASNSGGTLHWFDDISLSNLVNIGDVYSPSGVTATTSYYVVDSLGKCASVTEEIILTIDQRILLDDDTVRRYYCDTEDPLPLTGELSGVVGSGSWYDVGFSAYSGTYDPGSDATNIYYYITDVQGVCPGDTAILYTYVEISPDAGDDRNIGICDADGPIDLMDIITTSDITGSWFDASGTSHDGVINPSTATNGSYFYILPAQDICSDDTAEVSVVISSKPDVDFNSNLKQICEGESIDFFSGQNYNLGASYSWDFGNGVTSTKKRPSDIVYTQAGKYTVSLTVNTVFGINSPNCITTVDSIEMITVTSPPVAEYVSDKEKATLLESNFSFFNSTVAEDGASYLWNFGDGTTSTDRDPMHLYSDTGSYQVQLIVTDKYNCSDTIYNIVKVEPDFIIFMPNAFTPNGDGVNDDFKPVGFAAGIKEYHLEIWDHLGNKVFETDDVEEGWDGFDYEEGIPHVTGTFNYVIHITDFRDEVVPVIKGQLLLVQ